MASLEQVTKEKMSITNPSDDDETIPVVLRTAPWDWEEEAISVPYKRKDGHYARSSPTMPREWAYAVARAGIERWFPKTWVTKLQGACNKRLAGR